MLRPPQQAPPAARPALPGTKAGKGVLPAPPGPAPGHLRRAGSINMTGFQSLLDEHKIAMGEVSVKEAYQFFKRIESQRQRKSLDANPAVVLSLMQDQLKLLHHRRGESFRSLASSSTRSIIPPPPSRTSSASSLAPALRDRSDSQTSMLQRTPSVGPGTIRLSQDRPPASRRPNRQDSDSSMIVEEARAGLDQARQLMRGLQDASSSPDGRNRGRKQLPPPPQLPPSQDPPAESRDAARSRNLPRRNSESQLGANQIKAPGFYNERHSLSHSPIKKKPPPPRVPPPALRNSRALADASGQRQQSSSALAPLTKQNTFSKPPPPTVNGFVGTNPTSAASRRRKDERKRQDNNEGEEEEDEDQEGLLDFRHSQEAEHTKQASSPIHSQRQGNASIGPAEREAFKLREKLTALENQVVREQNEKDRLREHLLQAQRELHISQTNLKEAEDSLGAIRERVASNEKALADQKEKLKAAHLDQKVGARKSRQRFDAAIDFMKGLLVETKFETLVQTLKSRLRMIVGAERAEIYVVDRQREELIAYRERTGARRPQPNGSNLWMGRFPMDTGIVGSVILDKTMQVVQEVEKDVRFDALVDGIGSNGVRSLVVYPILMRQEVVATVVVVNKLSPNGRVAGDTFTTQDISAVQDFATLTTLVFLQQQIGKTRSASSASLRQLNANASDAEEESDDDSHR